MIRTGIFVFLTFFTAIAFTEDTVIWNPNNDDALFNKAINFLEKTNKASEVTEIYFEESIDISKGKVVKRVKRLLYLHDDDNVESYGTLTLNFNEKTDLLTVFSAASINSARNISVLDPTTIQVVDSDTYNTFTDSKQAVLLVPGIEPESVLVLDYEVVTNRKLTETPWAEFIFLQNFYPRLDFSLNVSWPESETITWSSPKEVVKCDFKIGNLVCKANNISAVNNDTRVYWRDQLAQIQLSSMESWKAVVDLSLDAFNKAYTDEGELRNTISSIISADDGLEEKISKIHRFVARNIRYTSVSELGHQITPHSVSSILNNRFGDCKDKTVLLLAMLAHIGVDAHPVLVATDRTDNNKFGVPTINFFDHVVACFDLMGRTYCLDTTDTNTSWRVVPAWIQGKASLPLQPSATPSTIPEQPFRWSLVVDTHITFDKAGGQQEKQKRTYDGAYAGTMRGSLRGLDEKEMIDSAVNLYQQEISSEVTPKFTFSETNTLAYQFTIESEAEYSPFVDISDNLHYTEYDNWLVYEINSLITNNQYYPYSWPGLRVVSSYSFDVSNIWKLIHSGANLNIENEYGSLQRKAALVDESTVNFTTTLEIPNKMINVDQFDSFSEFLELVKRESTMSLYGVAKQ